MVNYSPLNPVNDRENLLTREQKVKKAHYWN